MIALSLFLLTLPLMISSTVWIALNEGNNEKSWYTYSCADACAALGGVCNASAYDQTRENIRNILLDATTVTQCLPASTLNNVDDDDGDDGTTGKKYDGSAFSLDYKLDQVKNRCKSGYYCRSLFVHNTGDELLTDDNTGFRAEDPNQGQTYLTSCYWTRDATCYSRGTTPGAFASSGTFCPCEYATTTSTPTETPTAKPTAVPFVAPTRRPTVNHPALALQKHYEKVAEQLQKEKAKLLGHDSHDH